MYDKLAVAICWYDDPSIYHLLDTIPKEVFKIVVDGRFQGNPAKAELSARHLRRRVSRYPNTIIINAPDMLESNKRNVYLDELGRMGKQYCLILDSDEFVIKADWNLFYERCTNLLYGIHHVMFHSEGRGGTCIFPRLWVNPDDWEYHNGSHRTFYNKKTHEIVKSGQPVGGTFKSILIGIDDTKRSDEWNKNTEIYQKELFKMEESLTKSS